MTNIELPTKKQLFDFLWLSPDESQTKFIHRISQILSRDEEELKAFAMRTIAEMEEQIGRIKKQFDIH